MRQSKNIRPIVSAICLMILFGMTLAPAAAANVTVNSGMKNSDIQNIINNAKAGDTINFNEGNYQNVSLVINKKLNVVSKKAVLYGNNSDKTNGQTTFVFDFTKQSSGAVLSGFNIKTNTDYAIILNNVKNVNIANNKIKGGYQGSIYLKASSNINLTKNTITNSGGNGVTIYSSNAVNLYKNLIYNNHGDAVTVKNSQKTNLTLNRILSSGLNGITLNTSKNTIVHNNSINNNNGEGIVLYDTDTTNITGNNITYNRLNGILFTDWTKRTYVSYNYFIHNLNGIYLDSISYCDIIVSNYIAKSHSNAFTPYEYFYTGNGIKLGDNYQETSSRIDIHYNTIIGNDGYSIQSNNNYPKFKVGPNFYGTNDKWSCGVCPMVKTDLLNAKVVNGSNGFKLIFTDPSNANQQVTQIIDQAITWTVSELNPDGTTTQIMSVMGQITNGTSNLKFTRGKNKTYIGTAIINGVEFTYQWNPDKDTGQSDNNHNGTSPDNGNGTKTNGTGGPSNSTGNGNGQDGNGTSSSNGTTGSGKDLTQVGLEGANANNGGQQSAGDSGSQNAVEVAVKNAINKTVDNPFNNLGIIALLGLIGIGYFKRDKFK